MSGRSRKSSGGRGKSGADRRNGRTAGGSGTAAISRGVAEQDCETAEASRGTIRQGTAGRGVADQGRTRRTDRAATVHVRLAGVPVEVGQHVVCEIVGLTHEGEGVGKVEGYTLFVPGTMPGEQVLARVSSIGKSFGRGLLQELLRVSADRVEPPCGIYETCGGCQLQHMRYDAQLKWKRQQVVDSLERIGKLAVAGDQDQNRKLVVADEQDRRGKLAFAANSSDEGIIVHPVIGMAEPWRYRNKAQVPIGAGEAGLIGGFYELGSHEIVDMDACLIQQEENEVLVRAVKQAANELSISPYDRESGRGLLRHVVVRHAAVTGQRMIVLVTNGLNIPHLEEWIALIREQVPGVVSICQNVNTERTPVVFGEQTRTLWGEDVIYDEIDGVRFAISPRSFFQVNPQQTKELYQRAVAYAGLTGEESVIDAYCGIGTITLFLARYARHVYGVEIVPEAIMDAKLNAELNGIRNVTFEAGAAEIVMPRWETEGIKADVIVVDPPRKGCDSALLQTILKLRPARVVYVSCNPATLARDLRVLEDGGYRTVEVQPVDMFPHSGHIESVALLVRDGTEG